MHAECTGPHAHLLTSRLPAGRTPGIWLIDDWSHTRSSEHYRSRALISRSRRLGGFATPWIWESPDLGSFANASTYAASGPLRGPRLPPLGMTGTRNVAKAASSEFLALFERLRCDARRTAHLGDASAAVRTVPK